MTWQDVTVGEAIAWIITASAIAALAWKGVPLARKLSRFVDGMIGYTDAAGERHPGLIEQVRELVVEVRGLRTSVRTAATRIELDALRSDLTALDERVTSYHPEVGA